MRCLVDVISSNWDDLFLVLQIPRIELYMNFESKNENRSTNYLKLRITTTTSTPPYRLRQHRYRHRRCFLPKKTSTTTIAMPSLSTYFRRLIDLISSNRDLFCFLTDSSHRALYEFWLNKNTKTFNQLPKTTNYDDDDVFYPDSIIFLAKNVEIWGFSIKQMQKSGILR